MLSPKTFNAWLDLSPAEVHQRLADPGLVLCGDDRVIVCNHCRYALHNCRNYIRKVVYTSTRKSGHRMQKMPIRNQPGECHGAYSEETQIRDERTMCASRRIHQRIVKNRANPRRSEVSRHQQSSNSRHTNICE
jgi:hypothetical protein